jgi:mono/diheme cytochrome c family protein
LDDGPEPQPGVSPEERPRRGRREGAVRLRLEAALLTLAAVIVLMVAGALWVVATGAYDVAATADHWPLTERALNTLRHRSVAARAGRLPVPIPADADALAHGFQHFHAMCVECHGAPGFDRGESGQGLNPTPPRLEERAHEWTDAELFRITKHGIRMAGMPAFGPTHTDEEIAAIVGFLRHLETMTEEEYADRVRTLQ